MASTWPNVLKPNGHFLFFWGVPCVMWAWDVANLSHACSFHVRTIFVTSKNSNKILWRMTWFLCIIFNLQVPELDLNIKNDMLPKHKNCIVIHLSPPPPMLKMLKLIFVACSSYSCCNNYFYTLLLYAFSHFCPFYMYFRWCPQSLRSHVKRPQKIYGHAQS